MTTLRNEPPPQKLERDTSAFLYEVAVPRLISMDTEANCALLEWVNGSTITSIGINEIENACTFIEKLHDLRKAKNAVQISPGVDQCLSGADVVAQLEARLERLKHSDDPSLRDFLADRSRAHWHLWIDSHRRLQSTDSRGRSRTIFCAAVTTWRHHDHGHISTE